MEIPNRKTINRLSALQSSCLYVLNMSQDDFVDGCPIAKMLGINENSHVDMGTLSQCIRCEVDYNHIKMMRSILDMAEAELVME